jgi:hypothetical protein
LDKNATRRAQKEEKDREMGGKRRGEGKKKGSISTTRLSEPVRDDPDKGKRIKDFGAMRKLCTVSCCWSLLKDIYQLLGYSHF